MKCHEIRKRLMLYLDGQLDQHETEAIRTHMAECGECAKEAALLSRVWDLLRDLPQPETVPNLIPVTLERLRTEAQESFWHKIFHLRIPVPAAATVALMLGIFVGAQLGTVVVGLSEVVNEAEDPLYLEVFHELPSQTIGQAYIELHYPQGDEDQ